MQNFQYIAARTVSEATEALATSPGPARPLAGGTDLIVQLREGRRRLSRVVDLGRIDELRSITFSDSGAALIGAAAPCSMVYKHPTLIKDFQILVDSASIIGSVQIQSRASIGGNLCNASPSADSIPSLICLDAVALIAGPDGEREVPVEEFCTGPGQNVLASDEILVGIRLSAPGPHQGGAYLRFIPRNEMDIAVVGAGTLVRVDPDTGTIAHARIALSAVAPTPLRVKEAEDVLIGQEASPALLAQAAEIAAAHARPISDVRGSADYRRHLVGVMVRRSLMVALGRAGVSLDGFDVEGGYADAR